MVRSQRSNVMIEEHKRLSRTDALYIIGLCIFWDSVMCTAMRMKVSVSAIIKCV